MKSVFREFFNNEKVDFNNLDDSVLIVFDTNIMLNIYRFSESTRNTFLSALEKVKNNIWIPYQVGLEFHLHRREIMVEMETKKDTIVNNINNETEKYLKAIKTLLDTYPIKSIDGTEVRKKILNQFNEEINKVKNSFNQEQVVELDNLINKNDDKISVLAELFEGKVGGPFSQTEIDSICKEGELRYEEEIPPGYKDRTKKDITKFNNLKFENKYGDLIAWKQIINKAKDANKKTVVFITGDVKPDWWYEIKGKKIGARAELKKEMLREADADLMLMDINTFLKETSTEIKLDLVETKNPEENKRKFMVLNHSKTAPNDEDYKKIIQRHRRVRRIDSESGGTYLKIEIGELYNKVKEQLDKISSQMLMVESDENLSKEMQSIEWELNQLQFKLLDLLNYLDKNQFDTLVIDQVRFRLGSYSERFNYLLQRIKNVII